jgi:hypothetical protein
MKALPHPHNFAKYPESATYEFFARKVFRTKALTGKISRINDFEPVGPSAIGFRPGSFCAKS